MSATPPTTMFRIGVFAIIADAGRVLLAQRRDSGWWNLPGGGLESAEAVDEGVVREVREETALDVTVKRLVGVYSKPQIDEVVIVFECQPIGGTLTPTDESAAFVWASPNALPDKTLPKHVERIRDWATHRDAPYVRTQRDPSLRSHV